MHCLNIVRMIISPGSSHASWVDVVGHDVTIISELHIAKRALPVLFYNLVVEQSPHLRVGPEFAVSPRMMWILDPLQTWVTHISNFQNPFPAAAG
jgi:hypothetical protein